MKRSYKAILKILFWTQFRKRAHRLFLNPPRGTRPLAPYSFPGSQKPEAWTVDGSRLLTLSGDPPVRAHVIFLPGGAYIVEATPFHRAFAEKLAKTPGLSVTLIDYPKSPEHTYQAAHDLVREAYHQLRDRYPDQEICLLGDSAGGGLALAFQASLRDQGITPLPRRIALISPWLDLSLSHPEIPAYSNRDPILPLEGLRYAADLYAGGADLKDPALSPLFGDLNGLGEILLVFGTEEIFYPDCLDLIARIEGARGTRLAWEVGKDLIHAWPLFPFPESAPALERIAQFLLGKWTPD